MTDLQLCDLMLMMGARDYDLFTEEGRCQSNKDVSKFFLILNKRLAPEVVYEIGAYDPRFSVEIKKALKQSRSFAFEANPYNFERCRNNEGIAENSVEYLHLALTDHTGEAEFFVQRKLQGEVVDVVRGNNSLLMRAEDGVEYERVKVPAMRLDDFALKNKIQEKNFTAWIDVEGAAEGVLKGAGDMWVNCSALMIEVEQHVYWQGQWLFGDVADFLMKKGFVPVARDFEFVYQFNVIFVKQELLHSASVREAIANYHSFVGQRTRI